MKIGVLALQGAFARHASVLRDLGVEAREVRTPPDLDGIAGLVLPGGESTTMGKLAASSGLADAVAEQLAGGLPALGTCAGMILLATDVADGRADQRPLGVLDIGVRRNAFGRQVDSFEARLRLDGVEDPGRPFPAVFIRAPVVERVGDGVEVLARFDGRAVVVRDRRRPVTACSFHPELSGDVRLHQLFLESV